MSRSSSSAFARVADTATSLGQRVHQRLRHLTALEAHLIFRRTTDRFEDVLVQADFARARADDPHLSKDAYLRDQAPEFVLNRIRRRFGNDGLILMRSQDPAELFRVYAGMVSATRYRHFDADGGIRMTDVLARLDDAQQRALGERVRKAGLPLPMGLARPGGGILGWSPHGRQAFWSNFGYAVLNRGREAMFRLGPIGEMIGNGKHQLPVEDLHKPAHGMLDHADCAMTMHDAVLASKGFTPIYGGAVLRGSKHGPKPATPGGRLHYELVLQLAFLTGDKAWLTLRGQNLSNKIADLRKSGTMDQMAPKEVGTRSNPHTDLSAEDCCKMLMEEADAPRVEYSSMEIEHSLGQRVTGIFDRVTNWLQAPDAAKAALNQMTGVFDPANVHAVSPMQHFQIDGFAAYYCRPLRYGVFAPGAKRLGLVLMPKDSGKGSTPTTIPGRPYFALGDVRKPDDLIAEIEAALAVAEARKSNPGVEPSDTKTKEPSMEAIARKLKDAANRQTFGEKQRASIKKMADAMSDIDARIAAGEKVPLDEILDAVGHAGADRVKNPFIAMDGQVMQDMITVLKDLPGVKAAPKGYPQQQVRAFYESVIAAAKENGVDASALEGKL